jgi:hypothetical protein
VLETKSTEGKRPTQAGSVPPLFFETGADDPKQS